MSTKEIAFDDLMRRIGEDDAAAWELFVQRYSQMMYHCAWNVCGTHDLCEDSMQEAFLQVRKHAHRFHSRSSVLEQGGRGWLLCITQRCASNIRRRELRIKKREHGYEQPVQDEPKGDEHKLAVRNALATLSDQQRDIISLYYIDGMDHETLAITLGCTRGAARTRLSRAVGQLRKRIDIRAVGAVAMSTLLQQTFAAVPQMSSAQLGVWSTLGASTLQPTLVISGFTGGLTLMSKIGLAIAAAACIGTTGFHLTNAEEQPTLDLFADEVAVEKSVSISGFVVTADYQGDLYLLQDGKEERQTQHFEAGVSDEALLEKIRTILPGAQVSLTCVAGSKHLIESLDIIKQGKKNGVVEGVIVQIPKGKHLVLETEEGNVHLSPHWKGGMPKDGGGLDKKILKTIASCKVGDVVRIRWSFEERMRIDALTKLRKKKSRKEVKKETAHIQEVSGKVITTDYNGDVYFLPKEKGAVIQRLEPRFDDKALKEKIHSLLPGAEVRLAVDDGHITAMDIRKQGRKAGTIEGIIVEIPKGTSLIIETAYGHVPLSPHWKGGMPKNGGGLDKKTLKQIATCKKGDKVRIRWSFEERMRIDSLTRLRK